MGSLRAFVEADIPQVTRLHGAVFRTGAAADPAALETYRDYFTRVFLENPSRDEALPSLVYQEHGGQIVGFLGVVPRRMTMNGRPVQAAISSQFVVDPASHVGLVAVRLARAFLEGPQDLSISDEANDVARRLWEGLGGTTSLLHSLHWTRPLRPARLALSLLRGRARLAPLAVAAGPLAPIVDALATRMPHSQLHQAKPDTSVGDDLSEARVLACLPQIGRAGSLRVVYDVGMLPWLLARARARKSAGQIHAALIRQDQRVLGWYVYHLGRDHIANVLQLVSDGDAIAEVLDHLFYHAGQHGAVAAGGRLEPRHLQTLSDKYCVFHRRGPWVLIKAKKPELIRSFESGDASFSRLDGEWCLGF